MKHTLLPLRLSHSFLLCALLLCGTLSAVGQNVLFKVGGGLSGHLPAQRPVTAIMAGVGYEHEFSQRWGVTPGLFLQSKGWRDRDRSVVYDLFEDAYPTLEDNPDWNPETSSWRTGSMGHKVSLTYLTLAVPFNYYLRTGMGNYIVFSAGPYASVGLKAKHDIKGDPECSGGDRITYTYTGWKAPSSSLLHGQGDLRRLDAGVQAQVAYQFGTGFTVGLQGDISLLHANTGTPRWRNATGMITISYNFHQGNSYRQRVIDQMWQSMPRPLAASSQGQNTHE